MEGKRFQRLDHFLLSIFYLERWRGLLCESGLSGGGEAELGADAVDEVLVGGVGVRGGGEGVHVAEGFGDAVEEAADFGVEGEVGLEVGEVVGTHGFEGGIKHLNFVFPMLDVTDAASGFVDVGVGEDDGEDSVAEVAALGFGDFGELEHAAFGLEVFFREDDDDAFALAEAAHEVADGVFVADVFGVAVQAGAGLREGLLELVHDGGALGIPGVGNEDFGRWGGILLYNRNFFT